MDFDDKVLKKIQENWNQMDEAPEEDPIAAKNADERYGPITKSMSPEKLIIQGPDEDAAMEILDQFRQGIPVSDILSDVTDTYEPRDMEYVLAYVLQELQNS
jgi:hypothetical protein